MDAERVVLLRAGLDENVLSEDEEEAAFFTGVDEAVGEDFDGAVTGVMNNSCVVHMNKMIIVMAPTVANRVMKNFAVQYFNCCTAR